MIRAAAELVYNNAGFQTKQATVTNREQCIVRIKTISNVRPYNLKENSEEKPFSCTNKFEFRPKLPNYCRLLKKQVL